MALYTEERDLDIAKGGKIRGGIRTVVLRQYEYDGTRIVGNVYDGADPADLTGYSAVFWMRSPDGSAVEVPAEVSDAKNGQVAVTVTAEMTQEHGKVSVAYFELLDGDSSVTTDSIPIVIERSADLSEDEQRRYSNRLDALVAEWDEKTKNFRDIDRIVTTYQEGTSTTAPTGTWTSSMPTVGQGRYLWRRDVIYLTDGTTHTVYMYARQGQDNTTWGAATTSKDGLMSASDKKNLDDLKSAWDSASTDGRLGGYTRASSQGSDLTLKIKPSNASRQAFFIYGCGNNGQCISLLVNIAGTAKNTFITKLSGDFTFKGSYDEETKSGLITSSSSTWSPWIVNSSAPFSMEWTS